MGLRDLEVGVLAVIEMWSMDDACDICHTRNSMFPRVEVGLRGVGSVWIHQCTGCGFRQVRPKLNTSELESFYGGDYFDPGSPVGFDDYAKQKQRYKREAFFLDKELSAISATGRLLEVGCALGFLLDALARVSAWRVEGIELSAFAAGYARQRFGLAVQQSTLEAARFAPETFDYVVQKDLLEHVIHPRRHLEETWRIMRPGGRLWVVVPNGDLNVRPISVLAATLDDDALPVLDQGHLSFFSKSQLRRLFEETGFRCLRFRNIGLRRGLRALGYLPRSHLVPAVIARTDLTATVTRRDRHVVALQVDDAAVLRDRIDAEINRRHRRIRNWTPYFYYRHLFKRLDSLVASCAVGQDFDVLLEKV